MSNPPENRPVPRRLRGDQRIRPLSLGLTGLSAVVAGLCFVLLFRSAPTLAAQQIGIGAPTSAPGLVSPTGTPTSLPPATPGTLLTPPSILIPGGIQTPTLVSRPFRPLLPGAYQGIEATEGLWGVAQICTAPLSEPENSIDLAFNGATASCGPFVDGSTWTYVDMQETTLLTVVEAILEVSFYVSDWSNDPINLQVGNGATWWTVAIFGPGSPPPAALTALSYDVSTVFASPAEVNGAQMRFVGAQQASPDGHFLHLDEARLVVSDEAPSPTPPPILEPIPTPTAPLPEPTNPPIAGDPHVDYSATTASCAGCHRAHTAPGLVLRQVWPEEALCFACHTSGGPGTDVEPAFGYANTATGIFQHDVAATNGVHRLRQTEGSDFGGDNRHVECEDCHEPHDATRGPASAPMSQREMNQVPGVDPVWTAPGAPGAYLWLPQAEREFQVCFKCHSSFTTLPTYIPDGWDGSSYVPDGLRKLTSGDPQQVPDSRDLAQEFNPYNASFHPVVAQGRNQTMASGSFVPGWSSTSMVYCTDCHSNPFAPVEGSGPHGSPFLHLLSGLANYQTAMPDTPVYAGTELCFNCHDSADYTGNGSDSSFRRGNRNLHGQHSDNGSCYLCHDSHGSEQLHLLNLDVSIQDSSNTYLLSGYDGLPTNSQTFWQISPDGSEKRCWLVCHGHDHESSPYPNLSD